MSWEMFALLMMNGATLVAFAVLLRSLRTLRSGATAPSAPAGIMSAEAVLTAVPDPILVIDRNGTPRGEFGGTSRSAVRAVLDRLPDEAFSEFRRLLETAFTERREQTLRFVADDRWYVAHIVPFSSATEHDGLATVVLRDITSEKDAALRLDRLARRNEAILRSAMDGFFVVGEDLRFLEVNDAFCRMVGYTPDELLMMTITQIEAPETLTGLSATHGRTGLHHLVGAHRHKNGNIVQLEISVTVLRDDGRKILVGFARDVTERIRGEQSLRRVNERFETLVARMPLSYVVWTPDFRVQEWNAAARELFGYTAGEALGGHAYDLIIAREDRESVGRAWADVVHGEARGSALLSATSKSGERIACEWFNTVLRDASGRVECVASMIRDVSEPQRLQAQLRQSQKLESMGVLAGGVAHDFNNFLVSILCNASLVAEKLPVDGEERRYVQKIINASRRASELTRQMLTYSGRATFDVQPLELNAMITEMTDFLRAALPKNVTLTINAQDGLPLIDADAGQLQQVLMNLLINAAEAIGADPGLVSISTATRALDARQIALEFPDHSLVAGPYICLNIMDTGCGMSPETVARIFDPFFTTKFTGRGLGLATLLGIVRAHRGAIKVVSALNQGTEFTVLFPVARRQAAAAAAVRPAGGRVPPGATLLVIDDEPDIREVVRDVLESRGATVLTAEDGARGLEVYRENVARIDAVLLDMTMPGLSGDAVYREIKIIRPDARVILTSGYTESEAVTRFGDNHLTAFVQKPYTIDTLVEKVNQALNEPAALAG